MKKKRRYPIGAEYTKEGTHFRVWAPAHKKVTLVYQDKKQKALEVSLSEEDHGYFSTFVPELESGTLYHFMLGASRQLLPDPASRYQPLGVQGPSSTIDPHFNWTDDSWPGVKIEEQIIYELHIGSFTPEGTISAAAEKLEYLSELGITAIELMPLNEFPGHFGWGYDGVYLFAPFHHYGTPQDVKAFINKAHKLGIGVILDVVYNHFGPEGNYFALFTTDYFNPKEITHWGQAINFDHPSSREYFVTNAIYWIEEYHFDGLRVDATPWIFCTTPQHVLQEMSQKVRHAHPSHKHRILIGECEQQDVKILHAPEKGGDGFDALWNDDFHHSVSVRLKGKREAYYTDYLGSCQEFISALKYGFLYQGQYYFWQNNNRGTFDLSLPPSAFVIFLENHDQVANTGNGTRLCQLADYGNFKALSCLLLLSPNVPLIFQGQEFGSSAPFNYFADHHEELSELVFRGRKKEMAQFPSLSTKESQRHIKKPSEPITFMECKLDFDERFKNKAHFSLYKDLINLRKKDSVFKSLATIKIDGAVINQDVFLIRYFGGQLGDRLIIINFGADYSFNPGPEPLIVAGSGLHWQLMWSSEDFIYGGEGTHPLEKPYLRVAGHSAIVLKTKLARH